MAQVTVESPTSFGIIINHDSASYGKEYDGPRIGRRRVDVPAGLSVQDEDIANHPYAKAHGVKILGAGPSETTLTLAQLTAAAEKSAKGAAKAQSEASAAADRGLPNAPALATAAAEALTAANTAAAQLTAATEAEVAVK